MAYFAEIGNDGIVLRVIKVSNSEAPDPTPEISEPAGRAFIQSLGLVGDWKQTSYTSRGGQRIDPDTGVVVDPTSHFRYNYASPGFTYDPERDAFIPPTPHPDAMLDETTCLWIIPPEVLIDASIPDELTE